MKSTKRVIPSGALELYTEAFGDPKKVCLLLISGAMAPGDFWSDGFCKLASKYYYVIRYDHRDIGRSSAVEFSKDPYTLKDLARDAINVLAAYDIKKAHFAGHSMGGHICQHIALEHPARALSITPISSGPIAHTKIDDIPLTDGEENIIARSWALFNERSEGNSPEDRIKGFMRIWEYLNGTFPFDEALAETYTKRLLRSPVQMIALGNNHEKVMGGATSKEKDIIEKIRIPTHVIHGNRDPIALPRYGRALGISIPGAWLDMIEGMGHVFFNKDLEKKIFNIIHLYIDQL
ncbi:MAG: Aclacinomycin methylesterase RdmC [Chlamydiia bacterium]|nr:Aclacinomycin methylesterase RdmC [Chlamydiia bacterium]